MFSNNDINDIRLLEVWAFTRFAKSGKYICQIFGMYAVGTHIVPMTHV